MFVSNDSIRESIEILYHQPGHLKSINAIQEIDGVVFTGGLDGRVCIWDTDFENEIGCLYAHNAAISDIQKIGETKYFITAAQDLELKIWSLEDYRLVAKKKAHSSTIIGAKPWKDTILSAGRDHILKKWKLENDILIEIDKTKISDLERFFVIENLIVAIHHDGLISLYSAETLEFFDYLVINSSSVLKAMKKATRKIRDYKGKDARFLLQKYSRRNGIPILTYNETQNHIYFGHVAGMITKWDKKRLKAEDIFFSHGKNITGLAIDNDIVYISAMDNSIVAYNQKTENFTEVFEIEKRVLSFLKLSSQNFLLGFESGVLGLYNNSFKLLKRKLNITPISSMALTPDSIILSNRNGEIITLDVQDLKLIKRKKLYNKPILGVFYYENRIVVIGDSNSIFILNIELEIIKTIDLPSKPTKIKHVKRYVSLTPNLVFDMKNDEVIKGEVSKQTEKEIVKTSPFTTNFSHGDASIIIDEAKLSNEEGISNYYFEGIIGTLRRLINAKKRTLYTKIFVETVSTQH